MHVSALRIYPVKSTAGIDLGEVAVHPWGLADDRRWMVIDGEGETITARTHRQLLHVTATPQEQGGIELTAPDAHPLFVDAPRSGEQVAVGLSRLKRAVSAGGPADDWFSRQLGETVRLVWLDDPRRRTVGTSHGGETGDALNLSDAGPILLTSTASLGQLNVWMAETAQERQEPQPAALDMVRFRPSIVVDDVAHPFAEDDWKRVRVGDVEMRFGEHCDRCVLTTIDPVTLGGGKEPTRTLALKRQWDHEVFFGIRLIPVREGTVRIGDEVSVG